MRALLVLLGLLLLAVPAHADPRTDKEVAEAASAYLDPEQEFLWRHRKRFQEALGALKQRDGVDALVDIDALRQIVYQGRHFLPRFSDKTWQRDPDNDITEFKKDGPYRHVVSERYRFSYGIPKSYPGKRVLANSLRPDPFPLLLSIHEERDTRNTEGEAETYPGGVGLKRKYPRSLFAALYERWLMVAPVAARAKFLEDGAIRHRYLTGVLTNLWRRYHVDFDRIIVDGTTPAAALAAAFPHVFAGLVLRTSTTVDPDVVRNYASVPVFVVDDVELARTLKQHGHPNVSSGDDALLADWLDGRRRKQAIAFSWRWKKRPDHQSAHWVVLTDVNNEAPRVDLAVDASVRNTIRIDTHGVRTVNLFLSDEIVDLDQPVRLVVNGEVRELGVLERDFDRLFEKDPEIRTNMNFGWLYTALVDDVRVGPAAPAVPEQPQASGPAGSAEDEAKAEKLWRKAESASAAGQEARSELYYLKILELGPTSYRGRAVARLEALGRMPTLQHRLAAQEAWLKGRPDEIEEHLGSADDTTTATQLLPFALRDLWWRPRPGSDLRERSHRALKGLEGTLADQLRWILAGGGAPYPTFALAADDPWPVLTALVLERQMRETTGARWLPDESPVVRRKVLDAPEEWQDWYARWNTWFYETYMRSAYEGEDIERLSEAVQAADAEQARQADDIGTRNAWLALLAGLLFVGGAFVAGRRASRR